MAPTGATLESFAVRCNEFFIKDALRFLIDDLVFWACDRANPHWIKDCDRRARVGSGVKPLLKGLLKFYRVSAGGRFQFEDQFTEEGWISTSKGEILKMAGEHMTENAYRFAKRVLVQKGILKVICRRRLFGRWISKMFIKLDLDRLSQVLEELPVMRTLSPETNNYRAPAPPLPPFVVNHELLLIKDNVAEAVPVSSQPATGVMLPAIPEVRELTASADGSFLKFSDQNFNGQLDIEGEQIVKMIREHFGGDRTNGLVRRVQSLRHLSNNCNMTAFRVSHFFDLISYIPAGFPNWMNQLTSDQFLHRNFWRKIAREIDRWEYDKAYRQEMEIKQVEIDRMDALQTQQLLETNPEAFIREIEKTERDFHTKPWLMYFIFGLRFAWDKSRMDFLFEKARPLVTKKPVFFHTTDSFMNWSRIFNLSITEQEQLHKEAEIQLRSMRWAVYLGQKYGTLQNAQ